jgi:Leucine-rich repeat (LRR) protein
VEGLAGLSRLTALDLAANRLRELAGLDGLRALRRLSLAHNQLAALPGLAALQARAGPRRRPGRAPRPARPASGSKQGRRWGAQGAECALASLDLRGNRLGRLPELAVLAGCPHLRTLLLQSGRALCGGGSPGAEAAPAPNPLCALPGLRAALAAALPQLRALDGAPLAPERAALPAAAEPATSAQVACPT